MNRGVRRVGELVKRYPSLAVGLLVFAVALLVRLPDLGAGTNVDAVIYWFGRTQKFWAALHDGRFLETYFSPHPGVTIMWLSGAAMRATGTLTGPVSERTVIAATAPLAFLASVVPGITVPLLHRVLTASFASDASGGRAPLGPPLSGAQALATASFTGALLATEPFLVAHARTFHLDATATGFVWLGVLLAVLVLVERRAGWAVLSGVCFGVAMLTRMLSGSFVVGLVLAGLVVLVLERRPGYRLPGLFVLLGAAAAATIVALWPALWVAPLETLGRVLRESMRTVEEGHRVFSWGTVHDRDAGASLYAGVILMRLSPEVLLFTVLGLALAWSAPRRPVAVLVVLACAYAPPAMALLLGAKKGDRYPLLFFPFFATVSAIGLLGLAVRLRLRERFAERTARVGGAVLVLAFFALRLVRLASIHPMAIAWCASYPGLRCEDVITLGNGEGFRDAALWIAEHSPVKNPRILAAYADGAVLTPWLRFRRVRDGKQAHFVISYLSSDQRGLDPASRRFGVGEPLHEVSFEGRTYVRIFRGPAYPDVESSERLR